MPNLRNRKFTQAVLIIAGVLLVARMCLPVALQHYVNRTLDRAEHYSGHVGDIDLALLAGAYEIEDIKIVKSNGEVEQPLFSAPRLRFSLLWSALLNGAVVGEVQLTKPRLNFVDSPRDGQRQSGTGEPWLSIADDLFPLRIDRLEINGGLVSFNNADASPSIRITLDRIDLVALNIANSRGSAETLETRVRATANSTGEGRLSLQASVNPDSPLPTFDLDLEAKNVALADFENLLNHYAPFDLEAGSLDLALELASDNGELSGYIKPVLHDIQVFSWKGDVEQDNDGLLGSLAELFAAGLAELFENQPADQFATEIPVNGTLENPETGTLAAVFGILSNAFVEALQAEIDHSISLKND